MCVNQNKKILQHVVLLPLMLIGIVIPLYSLDSKDIADLELVAPRHAEGKSLVDVVAQPSTQLGREALGTFLQQPLDDKDQILVRQRFLKKIAAQDSDALFTQKDEMSYFDSAISLFVAAQDNQIEAEALKEFFFSSSLDHVDGLIKPLNTNEYALTIKHMLSQAALFNPLIEYLLIHVGVDHLKDILEKVGITIKSPCSCGHHHHGHSHHHGHGHKHKHERKKLMIEVVIDSAVQAFHIAHLFLLPATFVEMYNQLEHKNNLVQAVHTSVLFLSELLKKIVILAQPLINDLNDADAALLGVDGIKYLLSDAPDALLCRQILLDTDFTAHASTLSFGKTLKAYDTIVRNKNIIKNALRSFGSFDALIALAQEVKKSKLCFTDSDSNRLVAKNFYNPLLQGSIVLNSFEFDETETVSKNIALVTGPNGAGKSTIIKALTYNVILAQTFGVAAAEAFSAPLYSDIIAYLTVSDDITHNLSRFVAASMRAESIINRLNVASSKNKPAWCFIDDALFDGTTTDKRVTLSVDFVRNLTQFSMAHMFVISHLPEVAHIARSEKTIQLMHVPIVKQSSGRFVSTYLLHPGLSPETDPTVLLA